MGRAYSSSDMTMNRLLARLASDVGDSAYVYWSGNVERLGRSLTDDIPGHSLLTQGRDRVFGVWYDFYKFCIGLLSRRTGVCVSVRV